MKAYRTAADIINSSNSIGVISHKNPDGDTVCSALALVLVLRKLGKTAELVCDDVLDPKLDILPRIELYNQRALTTYETVIVVDSSDIERIGEAGKLLSRARNTIAFDHHITHVKYTQNCIVRDRSSTCEIIFDFIKECFSEHMDNTIAEILFAGLITDTGGFGNSSVTAATHAAAAELLDYKFDSNRIYYHFIKAHTYATFKLKMAVLSKAMFFAEKRIAIVVFSKQDFSTTNTDLTNTSGLLYDIINIDEVSIAVAVSEVSDKNYKISVRTKGAADAAAIALAFGGGGHAKASGFVRNGYIENVIDDILKVCADNL